MQSGNKEPSLLLALSGVPTTDREKYPKTRTLVYRESYGGPASFAEASIPPFCSRLRESLLRESARSFAVVKFLFQGVSEGFPEVVGPLNSHFRESARTFAVVKFSLQGVSGAFLGGCGGRSTPPFRESARPFQGAAAAAKIPFEGVPEAIPGRCERLLVLV